MSELTDEPKKETLAPNTKFQCQECKLMFYKTKDNIFTCPKCGSPNILLMIMD